MNYEKRFVGGPDGILREEELNDEQKAKINGASKPPGAQGPLGNKPGDILYGDENGVLKNERPKSQWKVDFERSTGKVIEPSEAQKKIREYFKNKNK